MFGARLGVPYFWLVCLFLLLASLVAVGKAFLLLQDARPQVENDPQVRQAYENWWFHHREGAFDEYREAERQAEARLSPSMNFRFVFFFGATALASLMALIELIAFGFVLGKSGIAANYRWYVTCIAMFVVGLLGVMGGLAGLALLHWQLGSSPEIQQARADADRLEHQFHNPGASIPVADPEPSAPDVRQAPSGVDQVQGDRALARKRLHDVEQAVSERGQPMFIFFAAFTFGAAVLAVRGGISGLPLSFCVLLYKLWEQVQDGAARTTAGKAVGFLFIPFFNFYWAFVALPGLADELNRCARRRPLDIAPASRGLFVTYCILCFAALVPYLGILVALAALGVAVAAFRSATRVALALAEAG
jgi:hypothetical protein